MPIVNKTKNTAAIYNHGREVVKVYDHGSLVWQKGSVIPNGYTMCDYIYNSSTGGGGVDLGFKFRLLDYSVEAKFKQDEISNGMICGTVSTNAGTIWLYNYLGADGYNFSVCYNGGWQISYTQKPLDTNVHIQRYEGSATSSKCYLDGQLLLYRDLSAKAAEESTDNLCIFDRRERAANPYKGRIYYLKVWNTATEDVICNLIPCSRNSDGAAGFWDTAQERFFTSTYWTAHFDNE